MVTIKKLEKDKNKYLDLLLLGDESEKMIDKYFAQCDLFGLFDSELKGVCAVIDNGGGAYEVKNIAFYESARRLGYGTRLISFLPMYYDDCQTLLAGTGDSGSTVPFYEKQGFVFSHRVKNFFTANYPNPIVENGVMLGDMVYYKKDVSTVLSTERLTLRKMTDDDFDSLCKILCDKDVMYAYEHPFSLEEARQWLDNQKRRYKTDGFGLWAVILTESGEMIGQCGLTLQDAGGEQLVEAGYLFQKRFWHQGYASEAARACIEYAFDTLGENRVCTIIRDNNISSQNVARRNGLKPVRTFVKHYYGMDMPHIVFIKEKSGE